MSDHLEPYHEGGYFHPADPGEPQTGVRRLSVTDLEADILAAIVVDRHVLEIGTGLGVSTRALASTALTVRTVDIDPWVRDTIWPTLPANVTGATSVDKDWRFDAVFIDADHSTEAVRKDLATARKHVKFGGVILAHDTNYGHVRDGLDFGFQFIPTTHGIGIAWVR